MGLSSISTQLACFCFIAAAQAFTTFHPNCTIPTTTKSYVSGPNSRGTFDILWSSLFTIFACTWTVHHPNVPRQLHGYGSGRGTPNESNCWRLQTFLKSMGRMILTIFAPEVIIAVAYNGRLAALEDHKVLKKQAEDDGVEWSLSHTYYANMGGFVIKKKVNDVNNEYSLHHLSGRDLHILRKRDHIKKLPDITKRGLKDRSKGDVFVKAISVIQIFWSTAQILVRGVRNLSICPLELTVLAFAACAVVIIRFYWKKPKSIGVTTTITIEKQVVDVTTTVTVEKKVGDVTTAVTEEKQVSDDDIKEMLAPESNSTTPKGDENSGSGPGSDGSDSINPESIKNYSTKPMFSLKTSSTKDGAPMRIDTIRKGEKFDHPTLVALLVGTMMFGAIHIGAWHFPFPTRVDLFLWKCATFYLVGCAIIPLIAVSFLSVAKKLPKSSLRGALSNFCGNFLNATGFLNVSGPLDDKGLLNITGILNFTSILLYIIARLIIIVEMLRTLFFLPPDAFVSSWSSSLPHLA